MNYKWLELTKQFEGLQLKPYRCPAGKLTIGYGHNLEDKGISKAMAEDLLKDDMSYAYMDVYNTLPCFKTLNQVRQYVLVDMCFNLGIMRLLGFKKMLAAVTQGDYERASAEMLDSKWARQVGKRAKKLAKMMKRGELV